MSKKIKKKGKISGTITSFLILAIVMVVNVQIGLNDGDTTDIGLFGLEASVFVPASVATCTSDCSGCWTNECTTSAANLCGRIEGPGGVIVDCFRD